MKIINLSNRRGVQLIIDRGAEEGVDSQVAQRVAEIVNDVRTRGDRARSTPRRTS